jgi:CyaY protein
MDEREFNTMADAALRRIEDAVEQSGSDVDLEVKPGGVLELEFDDGSKIIINRHTAAREIWVAAKSGGYHFRPQDGRWLGTRDGEELMAALARCMSEQSGARIVLPSL